MEFSNLSSSLIYTANTLAERHEFMLMCHQGLLTPLGADTWASATFTQERSYRLYMLSQLLPPHSVIQRRTALWFYTGVWSNSMFTELDVVGTSKSGGKPRPISPTDVENYPPLKATSMARTALDLLRRDLTTGIEALCHLLRAGADYSLILQRSRELRSLPGGRQAYALLRELNPKDLPKP